MRRLVSPLAGLLVVFAASSAFASTPVFFGGDVAGLYRQRPSFIHVTSDQNIRRIHWSSWGGGVARATATMFFSVSDGLPPAALRLKLTHIHRCGQRRQYLRLTVTFVTGTPPGAQSSYNVDYTCGSPFG